MDRRECVGSCACMCVCVCVCVRERERERERIKVESDPWRTLAWKGRECANIFICLFHMVLSIFIQKENFFLQISAGRGAAMLVRSLPVKSRRRLVHDVFRTFTIHISALFMTSMIRTARHKMTAFVCRVLATFKRRFLTNSGPRKIAVGILIFIFVFHSYRYGPSGFR